MWREIPILQKPLIIQKQSAMPWDQDPEQSTGNYSEDEQNGKQKWREEGGEAGRKREREKEEKNEKELQDEQENKRKRENEKQKQYPEKRLVSKSLMHTLWAKFKLNRCPTIQESLSLSFEFDMTHKQISQWFCKTRKKYNKEMSKRKHKKKHMRWRSLCCQGWSRTPALK
uniref:NANOG neighbor homeobox n=1 Tax=Gorilla gorilla gorilla TaxID=9595 RepID=G3S2J6_GORGO